MLSGALAAAGASIAGVLHRDARAADSLHAGSVGLVLRPGGRRLVGLPRGLAGHALGGEPAARADACGVRDDAGQSRSSAARWWAGTTRACSRTRPTRSPSPTSSAAIRIRDSSKRSRASRRTSSTIRPRRATSGSTTSRTSAMAGTPRTPSRMPSRDPSSRSSTTAPRKTEAGRVLVFGGDEVYPYPIAQRIRRAHRDALRAWRSPAAPRPDVFAIPGNHDWYDSLVAFSRTFCRPERGFAGCPTRQTRSYFALKLPANWWLLAIDLQLGADLDEPQVQYFQKVAARMDDAARLIFCVPEPRWILEDAYPQPLELRRAVEHAIPRREGLQAQGARVPHRRSALLQAARKRGRHPEDHLGRRRRVPASHACAGDANNCAMASRSAPRIRTRRLRGACPGGISCSRSSIRSPAGCTRSSTPCRRGWRRRASKLRTSSICRPRSPPR